MLLYSIIVQPEIFNLYFFHLRKILIKVFFFLLLLTIKFILFKSINIRTNKVIFI